MSEFEIISMTLSFIVGLGIAQLLTSFSAAIRARLEHPLHWLPFVWGAVILVFSVQYWFGLYDLNSTLEHWSWVWYVQMLLLAIALFLAGALLLPTRASAAKAGLLDDFFVHGRHALLAVVFYLLGWIPANARMNGDELLIAPNACNTLMAVVAIIAFRSRSERLVFAATALFCLLFAYTNFVVYSAPGSLVPPVK